MLIITVLLQATLCFTSDIIKQEVINEEVQKEHRGLNTKLGPRGFENQSGFDEDNETKQDSFHDSGKHSLDKSLKNAHLDKSTSSDEKFQDNHGGSETDFSKKAAHKKGQHKAGFHNTYYKDEKGSNSSYYDDNDDEGDEYIYNSDNEHFGSAKSNSNQGSRLEDNLDTTQNFRLGQFDVAKSNEKNKGDHRLYNKGNSYNNEENNINLSGGNYDKRNYYRPTQYYEDARYYGYTPRYYPPKKTITIYEDPRYFNEDDQNTRHTSRSFNYEDSIQLDIRPPLTSYRQYYNTDRSGYY